MLKCSNLLETHESVEIQYLNHRGGGEVLEPFRYESVAMSSGDARIIVGERGEARYVGGVVDSTSLMLSWRMMIR